MPLEAFYAGAGYSPYTDNPDLPPSVIFPNHGFQVLSSVLSLLGVSVVSWVFSRRTAYDNLLSLEGWKALSWPRLCTTLVFFVSWAFIFCAATLINGTGLSMNHVTCTLGIFSCIVLYALTKLFIYAYLIEKVWLVWSPKMPGHMGKQSRWRSPLYRGCLLSLVPFIVIIVFMIVGRIAIIRQDGACVIGLKGYASLSLLIYDLLLTLCLTLAFVWPLTRGDIISMRLRRIASRTLVASIVALITSTVNITVLTSMHGKQLGWVCLASCGTDVTINAMVIAWVSGGQEPRFQRCQHNCSGSIPVHGTPDSLGPQSPLPKAGSKWRARHDDVNWGLEGGPTKFSAQGEWSPSAKLEFDFGRRGSAAGLLAPGSGDSVLGAMQEPKSPPLAVPRSGLPFSLPKVTEHSTPESIGVDISATAPGHAVYHLPLPSPRFDRKNQLARSASQLSETAPPPSTRSISLPQQPDSTPGAGPSSGRRHKSSRRRSLAKYGQETVFTQGTSQTQSGPASPRRSAADDLQGGVRGTFMRGLSVLGLGNRSSAASDGFRPRLSRRGRSRDANDWTLSVQERMTQGTATTDISTIVFRHADSQFETSTIDSTDTDYCDPSPCSRTGSLHPWSEEGSHRSVTRIDERPGSSGDDTEPGCLATVEKTAPVLDDRGHSSSEGPPPYQTRPDTQETRDS